MGRVRCGDARGERIPPLRQRRSWLIAALGLVNAAVFLFFGFNARRAARVYRHPGG